MPRLGEEHCASHRRMHGSPCAVEINLWRPSTRRSDEPTFATVVTPLFSVSTRVEQYCFGGLVGGVVNQTSYSSTVPRVAPPRRMKSHLSLRWGIAQKTIGQSGDRKSVTVLVARREMCQS